MELSLVKLEYEYIVFIYENEIDNVICKIPGILSIQFVLEILQTQTRRRACNKTLHQRTNPAKLFQYIFASKSVLEKYDEWAFSSLDFTLDWLLHLALTIYMFVVVNFDALAQTSDFRIVKKQVVFLCWVQDSNQESLRHRIVKSRTNHHNTDLNISSMHLTGITTWCDIGSWYPVI